MPDSTRSSAWTSALLAAGLLVAGPAGCGAKSEYKRIVERYVDSMPDRARRIYSDLSPEVLQRMVRHDAQLACTVDRDRGKSTPEAPSAACRCYEAAGSWIASCAPWFQGP